LKPIATKQPRASFDEFVKHEGLDEIAAQLARTSERRAEERRTYAKYAKTLLRVGNGKGASKLYQKPLGHRLEIVAEVDPFSRRPGGHFPSACYSTASLSRVRALLGQFSPDGHWVAYASNETGRYEVYVQSFPAPSTKTQVSTGGGGWPTWRSDGKELFYISAAQKLMAVDIKAGNAIESGIPKALFPLNAKPSNGYSYAAASDGQRFLINRLVEGNNPAPISIVLNWTSDLKR